MKTSIVVSLIAALAAAMPAPEANPQVLCCYREESGEAIEGTPAHKREVEVASALTRRAAEAEPQVLCCYREDDSGASPVAGTEAAKMAKRGAVDKREKAYVKDVAPMKRSPEAEPQVLCCYREDDSAMEGTPAAKI